MLEKLNWLKNTYNKQEKMGRIWIWKYNHNESIIKNHLWIFLWLFAGIFPRSVNFISTTTSIPSSSRFCAKSTSKQTHIHTLIGGGNKIKLPIDFKQISFIIILVVVVVIPFNICWLPPISKHYIWVVLPHTTF